jgi:hypothetical protein
MKDAQYCIIIIIIVVVVVAGTATATLHEAQIELYEISQERWLTKN